MAANKHKYGFFPIRRDAPTYLLEAKNSVAFTEGDLGIITSGQVDICLEASTAIACVIAETKTIASSGTNYILVWLPDDGPFEAPADASVSSAANGDRLGHTGATGAMAVNVADTHATDTITVVNKRHGATPGNPDPDDITAALALVLVNISYNKRQLV